MVEVTVRKLRQRKPTKSRIVRKTVPTSTGEKVTIRSISADSPAFTDDFLRVFAANVRAARRSAKKQPA
jgi:hypothetical protein